METNSKGIASTYFSWLSVGKYKVKIEKNGVFQEKTTTIKITKAKTIVKAPKVVSKYNKSKYFKVTVKNKVNKKPVIHTKLKVKIYTGKKAKKYIIKTNKKGIAKLNTKKLKKGFHKVVITSLNKNYSVYAKSSIKIK